jgi:hypothetical protein
MSPAENRDGRMTRPAGANSRSVVRGMRLRRRRSSVPWIYVVYHAKDHRHRARRPSQAGDPWLWLWPTADLEPDE